MFPTSDSDDDVDSDTCKGPEEARDFDGPIAENLSGETEGVIVGDVVCDNGEREDSETELAKSAGRCDTHTEESANTRGFICCSPVIVDKGCSHGGSPQPLDKVEGDEETSVCPDEDLPGGGIFSHVDVVVHGK